MHPRRSCGHDKIDFVHDANTKLIFVLGLKFYAGHFPQQEAQGNLAGALKSYSDSLAIADRLAASDRGNAGWQRDLSVSYAKIALVHRQSGDKAKARGFLRQGQAIMVSLTKLSPDNAIWKNDLEWFEGQIKELEIAPGRSRASTRSSKHP